MDRALALALVSWESSRCPCGCGYPRDKAWDPEADGYYEARAVTCHARAAIDRWHRDHKDPEPGQIVHTVDVREVGPDE